MLQTEYLLADIGFDTAENEPSEVWPACIPPLCQIKTYAKTRCYIPSDLQNLKNDRDGQDDEIADVPDVGTVLRKTLDEKREDLLDPEDAEDS